MIQHKKNIESKGKAISAFSIINLARIFVIVLFYAVCISACSGSINNAEQKEFKSDNYVNDGHLIAIHSDNVQAAGYNAVSMTMTVRFNNGAIYEYYEVPADLWQDFLAAQPHPWSQVGYPRLVGENYSYRRIG